ncbi:MAG: nuclear transport factor 2 family protein [Phycisphaerales bacterium]|nr:nuclear transport factor 2 family protein [Phycisphaerales bacterium]
MFAAAVLSLSLSMTADLPASGVVADSFTTVYVVRHAEKSAGDGRERDPGLSAAGTARSEALARTLADAPIAAAFATEFRRTQQTIEPTAKSHSIDVTIAAARDPAALAARIGSEFRGRSVLVAGHSNTVPALLGALGVADPPALTESDYDDLFVVTLRDEAPPLMVHLHYGALDPSEALRDQLADEAAALLDAFHDAAAKADEERYFACFAEDGLFLGTDATERWTLAEFKAFALPHFQGESAWVYAPRSRIVNVSDDLACAWFDEQLESEKYGLCRGTGVLRRLGGQWRIVQYHLTMPIPNELAAETARRIRSHTGGGK